MATMEIKIMVTTVTMAITEMALVVLLQTDGSSGDEGTVPIQAMHRLMIPLVIRNP